MPRVYIKKADSYENIRPVVAALLDSCGADELLKSAKTVAVKPNLLMRAKPESATTTHPAFVKAVVLELKARGARDILVGDSPSGPFGAARINDIYKTAGLLEFEQIDGVRLLRDYTTSRRRYEFGVLKGELDVVNELADADALVNLAKFKTHSLTGLTLGVKNLFGCVPGLIKAEMHGRLSDKTDFCDMLCCLARLIAPALTLVDGVVAMQGDGPSGGKAVSLGLAAASRDVFLLDAALAHMVGFSAEDAFTLGSSVKLGLAPRDVDALDVADETGLFAQPLASFEKPRSAANVMITGRLPRAIHRPVNAVLKNMSARPVIRKKDCIGCGRCAEICPKRVITINARRKAVIDKSGCIRCFCCHEVCPEKAIDIRRSAFWGI